MQKRGTKFDLEIRVVGAEENGKSFALAGCDIFLELRDRVLLSAKLQTHLHEEASACMKGFAME